MTNQMPPSDRDPNANARTVDGTRRGFLAASALVGDGVGAYAGAAPDVQNPGLIPPALSIHSVEARHTSFLNALNGEVGFPDAFDEALAMDEVLEIASQFVVE